MRIGGCLLLVGGYFVTILRVGLLSLLPGGCLGLVIADCWLRCWFGVGGLGGRACCCGLWIAAY